MFQHFLNELGALKDRPVPLKSAKKLLKIQEKSFPRNITNYYVEFQKHHNLKWQRKDKLMFLWTVLKYLESKERTELKLNDDDWEQLSQILNIPATLLHIKWLGMLKTSVKQAPWAEEEDNLLRDVMAMPLESWTHVALEFNKRNPVARHAKQVRERWNNYLDPQLKKDAWTEPEQVQLLQLVQKSGKRWSIISKSIKGRTENQVKNAFNSLMNGYRRTSPQSLESEDEVIVRLLQRLEPSGQSTTDPMSPVILQQQLLLQALQMQAMINFLLPQHFGNINNKTL